MVSRNKLAVSLPYGMTDVGVSDGLRAQLLRYLEHLHTKHYSELTTGQLRDNIGYFIRWAEERGLAKPEHITLPILERYQRYLYYYRKANGKTLSVRVQQGRLAALKGYFRYLVRQHYLLYNPASELELPRIGTRLPVKQVLNAKEVETILALPDVNDLIGARDRAILEVLYSTGIRRLELTNLKLHDIDVDRGALIVQAGKGKKDRVVPIGERALAWCEKYRLDVRGEFALDLANDYYFLTQHGEPLTPQVLTQRVRSYVKQANVGKMGSCHMFRHTMATLMLENGADVRYIQAILGHSSLDTTQTYTHVAIRQLKAIHEATHPGSRLTTRAEREDSADDAKSVLLNALACEADSDDSDE